MAKLWQRKSIECTPKIHKIAENATQVFEPNVAQLCEKLIQDKASRDANLISTCSVSANHTIGQTFIKLDK